MEKQSAVPKRHLSRKSLKMLSLSRHLRYGGYKLKFCIKMD